MWLSSGNHQFSGAKDVLQFRLLQNAKGRVRQQCIDGDVLRKKASNVIENNYEKNDDVKTNQKKYSKQAFVDCDMEEGEDSDDCNDDDVDVAENYGKRYARKYNDDYDEEENEERKRPFKRKKTSLYSPFIKLNGGVKQEKSVASKNKRKFYN